MTEDRRSTQTDNTSTNASEEPGAARERLVRKTLLLGENDEADPEAMQSDVESLRGLVQNAEQEGTAFQSVSVAAVQILERALCYEREAAEAALSLGQQEKLESMVQTIERAASLLREHLDARNSKAIHLCGERDAITVEDGQPWWFALTDALEVLEEGTGRMSSLTTAQPHGSPARKLSQLIARLLQGHHDALLLEADDWIS